MNSEPHQTPVNSHPPPHWQECFLPCSGGWVMLWFSLFLVLGFSRMVLADGAVARHIQTGLFIIQHHAIPTGNYVWAINPQAPWLTHEFLGDMALGGAYVTAGLNGVALLGCVVIAVCVMWSYQLGRVRGMGPLSAGIIVFPVILATSIHWLSRSHIFSYLFFLIVYYLNFVSPVSLKKKALLTGLAMLFWTNFHGSIFIGIALAALKPASDMLEAVLKNEARYRWKALAQQFLVPIVAALAGTINLRGGSFYSYIFHYLTHPEIVGKGGEWRVLDVSFGISVWCFLLLFVLIILSWVAARRMPPIVDLLLTLGLFAAGCWSMRLIPYFAFIALPVMGPSIACLREYLLAQRTNENRRSVLQVFSAVDKPQELTPRQKRMGGLIKCALFVALCSVYLLDKSLYIADFPDYKLPVQAMDYICTNKINGLGFSFDNWGPYINWRTNNRIFIDEKTDFYPVAFLREYRTLYAAQADWKRILDKYQFTYAVLPPSSPLVQKLSQLPDWKQCVANKTSILFVHTEPSSVLR